MNQIAQTFKGVLSYNDNACYIITDKDGIESNITVTLANIYYSDTNKCAVKITKLSDSKDLFNQDGELLKRPNKHNYYEYGINSISLEKALDKGISCNTEVEIVITSEDADSEQPS